MRTFLSHPRRTGNERETAHRNTLRHVLLAAVLVGVYGVRVSRAQDPLDAALSLMKVRPIGDPAPFRQLAFPIAPAPINDEETEIENLLFEANDASTDGFTAVIKSALREYRDSKNGADVSRYKVIRVIAPAGYGKSSVFRYLGRILDRDPQNAIDEGKPRLAQSVQDLICLREEIRNIKGLENQDLLGWIRLDELKSKAAIHSVMLEELKKDSGYPMPAFAKLPAFDYDDHAAPGIDFLVAQFAPNYSESAPPILIIDSIDEIHPESATSLLKRVDEYVRDCKKSDEKKGEKRVLYVFVGGAPEGFSDYYRITQGGNAKGLPIELKLPVYPSVEVLIEVARSVARFNLFGEKDQPDIRELNRYVDQTIAFMNQYSFLLECPFNTANFGELIRVSRDYGKMNLTYARLQELFFQFLLGRNRAAHNRPALETEQYITLLEKIAFRYAGDVDAEGYFLVSSYDSVEIEVRVDGKRKPRKASFLVADVLNRSGVAYLDPGNIYVPKYRFYPSWVHEYLFYQRWAKLLP